MDIGSVRSHENRCSIPQILLINLQRMRGIRSLRLATHAPLDIHIACGVDVEPRDVYNMHPVAYVVLAHLLQSYRIIFTTRCATG